MTHPPRRCGAAVVFTAAPRAARALTARPWFVASTDVLVTAALHPEPR